MNKISVIVPVYKAEKYLLRCVNSILAQTYSELEVILVDDGSPDNCPNLCDKIANEDERVRVIHQKNAGVSAARNAGLDVATGKYCTFVDSDDFIESDMYDEMIKKSIKYGADVVICDCLKENEHGAVPYTHDIRSGFYDYNQLREEYYPHLLIMENVEYPATISNWLLLFKSELIKKVRYLEGVRYSEDLLFGAQLMSQAKSMYYMKGENYYHYWKNPISATHKFVPDKWEDYKKLIFEMKRYFRMIEGYDFSDQIDKVVLFFVYNAVGDYESNLQLKRKEKISSIKSILKDDIVRDMFTRLKIYKLPVNIKLKILTLCYKYQIGIYLLCVYFETVKK